MREQHREVTYIDGKRVPTPEYRAWQAMRNRCLNPNAIDYRYYGGRGIGIAPEWEMFGQFLLDVGRKPTAEHTLDRIKGDEDYSPKNCRWATRKTQARNRAYCVDYTIGGDTHKSWEWAELMGIRMMTFHHYLWRVKSGQWTQERFDETVRRKVLRNSL